MGDMETLKEEVILNRERYHKLSGELAVVKGRTEMLENKQHSCVYEESWGHVKEFIESTKGMRATITTMIIAIIVQIGSFLFLWGGLTTTVMYHDKTLAKICDNVQIVQSAYAGTK